MDQLPPVHVTYCFLRFRAFFFCALPLTPSGKSFVLRNKISLAFLALGVFVFLMRTPTRTIHSPLRLFLLLKSMYLSDSSITQISKPNDSTKEKCASHSLLARSTVWLTLRSAGTGSATIQTLAISDFCCRR